MSHCRVARALLSPILVVQRHHTHCTTPPPEPDVSRIKKDVPLPVQVDPAWYIHSLEPYPNRHSIHTALKEFFQSLRTNDTRADFFTVYRKKSEEFDAITYDVRRRPQYLSCPREL